MFYWSRKSNALQGFVDEIGLAINNQNGLLVATCSN
jgi:hypothetical protein